MNVRIENELQIVIKFMLKWGRKKRNELFKQKRSEASERTEQRT